MIDTRRVLWIVEPGPGILRWTAYRNGIEFVRKLLRRQAVAAAAAQADYEWEQDCVRSELIVRRRDGAFGERRTYGEDPHERLG